MADALELVGDVEAEVVVADVSLHDLRGFEVKRDAGFPCLGVEHHLIDVALDGVAARTFGLKIDVGGRAYRLVPVQDREERGLALLVGREDRIAHESDDACGVLFKPELSGVCVAEIDFLRDVLLDELQDTGEEFVAGTQTAHAPLGVLASVDALQKSVHHDARDDELDGLQMSLLVVLVSALEFTPELCNC